MGKATNGLKWELLRAIQAWQDAEPESDEERDCEKHMHRLEDAFYRENPDYTKDFRFFTVGELQFKLKQELCPDKIGERVE